MNLLNPNKDGGGDQQRMLIAVVICAGILLLWGQLFPQQPAATPVGDAGAPASVVSAAATVSAPSAAPPSGAAPVTAPVERRRVATLATEGLQTITLTNDGGHIETWFLEEDQYRDSAEGGETTPYEMVRGLTADEAGKGLFLPPRLDVELGGKPVGGDFALVRSDAHSAVLAWTDPASGVKLTRTYARSKDGYTLDLTLEAHNPSGAEVSYGLEAVLRGAQNDEEAGGSMFSPPVYAFEGVCKRAEDFERAPIATIRDDLEDPDDPTSWSDNIAWAGVDNRYFITAVVPKEGEAERCSFELGPEAAGLASGAVPKGFSLVTTRVRLKGGAIPAGGTVIREARIYVGPKKLSALRVQSPPLNDAIDFGWFTLICVPMLWLMQVFHTALGNWGLAIILLTVFVKLLTLPLTHKQYKSMAAMKTLQPQLKALQKKFADDKAKLQQEMMKLYREHKVNPLAGCLPMILMMPIYFSLYRTIYSAVELYRADFAFWITDLSEADPFYVTPILLGVLFFLQTRLNPSMGDNPQQKIIMTVMPVMFTGMMLFLPAGLVIYIFVNTLLGLVQQIFLYKKKQEEDAAPPQGAKKRRTT